MLNLNRVEKRTFFLLLTAGLLNGFVISAFQIYDVIAKKTLLASDLQITILVMLSPLSNLFSIWWGKILEHSRSISKYFLLTAFAGRLIFILMLFVNNYYQYLAILVVIFSFNSLISPAQNSIYQKNFSSKNRGIVFGITISIATAISIISSYIIGKTMDIDENSFRYIFAIIGIIGCFSSLILALIKIDKKENYNKNKLFADQMFLEPIKRAIEILRKNKEFAIFQRNFFVYGTAFMILLPVIPKYLVEYLNMSYTEIFIAKAIIANLGILFLSPFAGKIYDKKNPALFTTMAFASLSLYPLILFISSNFQNSSFANIIVYFAFFVYGIAMSAIVISWNVSSIYFAGSEDVAMYQSVHVTLTGIRSIFMPMLGFFLLKYFGIKIVFLSAFIIFLSASFLSYKLYLKIDEKVFFANSKFKQMKLYFNRLFPFSG